MAGEASLIEQLRRREGRGGDDQPNRAGWGRGSDKATDAVSGAESGARAPEGEINTAAYGYYRGIGDRALHIEFQRLKGSWVAPGYAWLPCPVWQPSGTGQERGQAVVLAYATGLKVTVRGRNLRPLYERILRQQVFRVAEMGEDADRFLPEDATVVYGIEVEEPVEQAG